MLTSREGSARAHRHNNDSYWDQPEMKMAREKTRIISFIDQLDVLLAF